MTTSWPGGVEGGRIGPASLADLEERDRDMLAGLPTQASGDPVNIFLAMSHHPRLLRRWNVLAGLFLDKGSISPRHREMAILRVANHMESDYELAHHRPIALTAGVSSGEIEALSKDLLSDDWVHTDWCVLSLVDDLVAGRAIGETSWKHLSGKFDTSQMLELVMLVGFYQMVGGFLGALQVPLEPEYSV